MLLVNLGTPGALTEDAVRAFLDEFLSDPLVVDWPRAIWIPVLRGIVLRRRPAKALELYRSIWSSEGSPLALGTERLADALGARLADLARVVPTYRYGLEGLAKRLPQMAAEVSGRIIVLPLFPQRTASSHGTVQRFARDLAERDGFTERLLPLDLPPDDDGYLAAVADRCREAFARDGSRGERSLPNAPERARAPQRLLVSFHGIPLSTDRREGGTYRDDCRRTFSGLLEALGWDEDRAEICYQSRFGPERWLEPATEDRLVTLAQEGTHELALVAPGFLTEGLETLEELDQRGAAAFRKAGGKHLLRAGAVVDHPLLLDSLEARIRRALAD